MTQKYPVLYEWAGKNFSGFAPDIPGCAGTGKTLGKVRLDLRAALEAHLQWMQDDGDTLPSPSNSATVDMSDDPEFPNPEGYYVIVEQLEVTMPKPKNKRMTAPRKRSARELTAA